MRRNGMNAGAAVAIGLAGLFAAAAQAQAPPNPPWTVN